MIRSICVTVLIRLTSYVLCLSSATGRLISWRNGIEMGTFFSCFVASPIIRHLKGRPVARFSLKSRDWKTPCGSELYFIQVKDSAPKAKKGLPEWNETVPTLIKSGLCSAQGRPLALPVYKILFIKKSNSSIIDSGVKNPRFLFVRLASYDFEWAHFLFRLKKLNWGAM